MTWNVDDVSMEEIRRRSRETDAWCRSSGAETKYRTPALQPTLPDWPTTEQLRAAVEALTNERRWMTDGRWNADEPRGRIVACDFNLSMEDGASEAASEGFFDSKDRPPWDTWLWVADGGSDVGAVLLAWVPDATVPAVDAGIDANTFGCVYWLEDRRRTVDGESFGGDHFEGVIPAPIPFSPPRMPQSAWWLPLLIGVPFVVLNFAAQSQFPSDASKWLALGGIVLAGMAVWGWNAWRARRSPRP